MPPPPGPWNPAGQPPIPPPGYYPQQPGWGAPPPPKPNNTIKWLLIGVGLLLVIAITVGVTVLVNNGGTGGDGQSTTTSASGPPIASADDNGPVEIITSEPTCQAWMPASDAMARVQENGWGDRDAAVPAAEWSPQQKAQYEAVAKSLRETADQSIHFAEQTPNRLVRELYGQFIYFARAYADAIPNYSPKDDYLAQANLAASIAIDSVCQSIAYGSAAARSTAVSPIDAPTSLPDVGDPSDPTPVVERSDSTCTEIVALRERLVADTTDWVKLDPNIPASDWTPDQRALSESAGSVMTRFADDLEKLGSNSGNAVFQDLASFGVVYFRAYVAGLSTYVSADSYLSRAGSRANNVLVAACQAVAE